MTTPQNIVTQHKARVESENRAFQDAVERYASSPPSQEALNELSKHVFNLDKPVSEREVPAFLQAEATTSAFVDDFLAKLASWRTRVVVVPTYDDATRYQFMRDCTDAVRYKLGTALGGLRGQEFTAALDAAMVTSGIPPSKTL